MPTEPGARRALIVDDSRTMRTILGRIMRQLGFAIVEAGDGTQALGVLAESGCVDVALVDWNMPGMSGYDLVCAMRANHAWDTMRVVMCTTESDAIRIDRARAAGANEFLTKPFTADMLSAKLAQIGVA